MAIHIVPIANDPDAENEVGLVIKNTTNIKIMWFYFFVIVLL